MNPEWQCLYHEPSYGRIWLYASPSDFDIPRLIAVGATYASLTEAVTIKRALGTQSGTTAMLNVRYQGEQFLSSDCTNQDSIEKRGKIAKVIYSASV